jgi:hypothetical protein
MPYSTSDSSIESQVLILSKKINDKGAIEELKKIEKSLGSDKLKGWFKYREIPLALVDNIYSQLTASIHSRQSDEMNKSTAPITATSSSSTESSFNSEGLSKFERIKKDLEQTKACLTQSSVLRDSTNQNTNNITTASQSTVSSAKERLKAIADRHANIAAMTGIKTSAMISSSSETSETAVPEPSTVDVTKKMSVAERLALLKARPAVANK